MNKVVILLRILYFAFQICHKSCKALARNPMFFVRERNYPIPSVRLRSLQDSRKIEKTIASLENSRLSQFSWGNSRGSRLGLIEMLFGVLQNLDERRWQERTHIKHWSLDLQLILWIVSLAGVCRTLKVNSILHSLCSTLKTPCIKNLSMTSTDEKTIQ